MDFNYNNVNPWALFQEDGSPPKKICESIIDNRFPNNFKKSLSLVTCNLCNVILLKNQAQQHFKIHHNKKLKKKFSKFKIPFNAVEGYECICEIRRKKQSLSNISLNNKSKDLFKLKHKHSENNITKQSIKIQSNLQSKIQIPSKSFENEEYISPKINYISEKSAIKMNEIIQERNEEDKKIIRGNVPERKNGIKVDNKKITKRSISILSKIDNRILKSTDLKLNIRINSDGLLTSSIKRDNDKSSNIFDQMSNFCDSSIDNKSHIHSSVHKGGIIKQSGYDKSYGCTVFTDQYNNSILIDNDKDEVDDYDCCESSLSNDSAYFSLPNTTSNSVTTASKTLNLCTSSVAPPLVTAYQYSNSTNKVSYCTNGSQNKNQTKLSAPMTMHVTRNLSYNSIVPPKSTVKHRFYVSGHSNQTIVNTLRKTSSENNDLNFLIENENDESLFDFQTSGVLPSLSKESQDICYFNNNKSSFFQNQKHTMNSKSYINDIKSMTNTRFWNCFEEKGLNVNILIPKHLKWIQYKSRKKSLSQLSIMNSKQSPSNIHKQSLSLSTIESSAPDNPLLTSYTIESSNIDDILQSDPMLTSEIMLDYQFPDRNQMSFQQRLLERGVISQRDIARSQRCLSFNINAPARKNKNNPIKSNILEYKRVLTNKNYAVKAHVLNRNGCISEYNVSNSKSCTMSQIKPTIHQQPNIQSTSIMSQVVKTNSIPKHMLSRHKQAWCKDGNLSRGQNQVSTFHEQCLSQNCKYINSDSKITVSPRQSRSTVLSTATKALDNRNTSVIFTPTSPNMSIIDSIDSYNSIFAAQNTLPNDSNLYSQQIVDRKCINLSKNDVTHHFTASNNEFVNYSQSYDEFNPPSITLHPNYQTIFNSQNKFSNHSTNHYNANFEL